MLVDGTHYRTIWLSKADPECVQIIDQRHLPHEFVVEDLRTLEDAVAAIRDMHVRGAPLIGATASFGLYLASLEIWQSQVEDWRVAYHQAAEILIATRPTAVNLRWAIREMAGVVLGCETAEELVEATGNASVEFLDRDVDICAAIGEHGLGLIEEIAAKNNGAPVNVLTHCNAGWLATVDWGTATSPIYQAHNKGIPVHVWVDETRPRNQGANLTAWELAHHGIPHTVIVDNAGGHLMQQGKVDMVIVGTDRTARSGDVANKIGTYLKALAAHDNDVPFYVALPSSTIDWEITDGMRDIEIEERSADEVRFVYGKHNDGRTGAVAIMPEQSKAANPAFDVTPARLVTGLITERGICEASEAGLRGLFPEQLPLQKGA